MPVRWPANSSDPDDAVPWTHWTALTVIVATAAFLRLFALETPELLHDEALVASAALNDLGYLFRRALHADAHPPYFYVLAKVYMQAGLSEGILRIVSALAGIGAVSALYRLGKRIAGSSTGLYAAALLAGHLLHTELSRTLRPHSLTILLTILATGLFLDMLEKQNKASLVKLTLTNLALVVLHFNTLLILGAQLAVGATLLLLNKPSRSVRYGLAFVGSCLALLPLNLWFAAQRLGKFAGVDTNNDMAWTATRSLANFDRLLTLSPVPAGNVVGWLLAAVGVGALFRHNRKTASILAAFILLPPLALIAARYGVIYEAWHVAFLLPVLLVACGRALSLISLPAQVLAPALAVVLGFVLWTGQFDRLYEPQSPMFNGGLGQRRLARALPAFMQEAGAVAFGKMEMMDFTNWYMRQFSDKDLTRFELAGDVTARLVLVSEPLPLVPEACGARLAAALGPPERTQALGPTVIRSWQIARHPLQMVSTLPHTLTFSSDAEKFLSQAASARDIMPRLSPLRDNLGASRYDAPATFSYRVENRSGRSATGLTVRVHLDNLRPENRFSLAASLDNGPAKEIFCHSQPLPQGGEVVALLKEPQGFTTLELTCSLICSSVAPSFNNIPDSIHFNGMTVSLEATDEAFNADLPVVEEGLNAPESDQKRRFRWGVGPRSRLFFAPTQKGEYLLELAGTSPLPGQTVEVLLDDAVVGRVEFPEVDKPESAGIPLTVEPGNRFLTLRYSRFNHGPGGAFAPDDGRLLALAFTKLTLKTPSAAPSQLVYVTSD